MRFFIKVKHNVCNFFNVFHPSFRQPLGRQEHPGALREGEQRVRAHRRLGRGVDRTLRGQREVEEQVHHHQEEPLLEGIVFVGLRFFIWREFV